MHYYKRNLGDYAKKAGRLSMLQHGSYTLLIDACYDREQFPTREEAIDWTWASSTAEVEAVDFVLSKFFTLEDGRYVQKRIQEEIAEYHGKSENNARIAREREAKRKAEADERARLEHGTCTTGAYGVNETPPNQEPRTKNQEPEEKRGDAPRKRSTPTTDIAKPGDVDQQTWCDWLALRKSKRAAVTETVLNGARGESAKAGMTLDAFLQVWCLRGSQGLAADWLRPDERRTASRVQPQSFAQQDAAEKRARWEQMTGRQWPSDGPPADFIDVAEVQPLGITQ